MSTSDQAATPGASEVRLHSPARLNALADGIVAIAMTLFLFGIASTPVASNALIRFGSVTRAVVFAAILLAFTSLMHLLLYPHVTDPRYGLSEVDSQTRRVVMANSAWVAGTFLVAIPLAFVLPEPAYAMLIWLVIPLVRRAYRVAQGEPPPLDD